jgi:hypothetical protein
MPAGSNFALHALMEVKWPSTKDKYPEMQATAYAFSFSEEQGVCWLPVFVLTRSYFRIGVAFTLGQRWLYSEIFEYTCANGGKFDPGDGGNVVRLLQFSKFLLTAAEFHFS